jgi:hypothetical protein
LLSLLKLYGNKKVITALAVIFVFLSGASASYASHRKADRSLLYRTKLGHDLDGDHIPETATIRQCGYLYQVSIHFTTGRPKLRLTTYVTEGAAGLSLETTDVNNDSKGDLVIISATSIRPLAVWLNQGRAKFKRVNTWLYGGAGRYTGPAYRHRPTSQPEPVGNVSLDPLPQATPAVDEVTFDDEVVALLSSQPDQRPSDSLLRQVPPRGPPSPAVL